MTAVFEKLLAMSVTAACVILVVLVIRLLLRKAPKKYSYLLWSVAAFRLVCPVSFRSVFSIFRFAGMVDRREIRQTIDHTILDLPYETGVSQAPAVSPPVTVTTPPAAVTVPPTVNVETLPAPEVAIDWASAAMNVAAIVWCVGLVALLIYGLVSYVRLRRRMANAVLLEGNVYQSDRVRSPFILGFVRPKIYLPFGLGGEQQSYVLAHERHHICRLDHVIRPAAFLILAVHWFNPLVWVAYYLMGRDMEMSCDEKVLGGAENIRKAYSTTLLSFAANRRFPSPSPLAFGETGVKGRIQNALNWKKPRLWVTIAAIVVCAVVLVVCAANPKEPDTRAAAHEWMSTVTAEDVTGIEAEAEGATGTVYGGENQYIDRLGNEKVKALVNKLNAVPKEALTDGESQTWRMSLTVDCGGQQYILRLSDNELGLAYGTDIWVIEDENLDTVVRNMVADAVGWDLVYRFETYESVECLDINSAVSQVFRPEMGNGTQHLIGKTHIITNADPDVFGTHMDKMGDWEPLSGERWDKLFSGSPRQAYDDLVDPMIRTAGDDTCLVSTGGELWLLDMVDDPNGREYVWAMYRLAKVTDDFDQPTGYYQPVKCVYMSPLSSYAAINGDSGYWYYVGNGQLKLISKQSSWAYPYDAEGEWQVLTEEFWRELASDSLMLTDSWETIKEYEQPMIRMYEDSYFLLDLDGELWVGKCGSNPNGTRYLWNLYCLAPMTEAPQVLKEQVATFCADLTHDGKDEIIEVVNDTETMVFHISVTTAMGRITLWEGEASSWRGGANGFYLYEREGKTYLMRWVPRSEQGTYCYEYEIFSLTETGEKQMLAENSFRYEVLSQEQLMAVDIAALRAFEDEVNALLADATLLVAVGDNTAVGPVRVHWSSPADEWEQKQQAALAEQDNVLATWTVDVTQDGQEETLTISKTETEGVHTIKIHRGDYVYWEARLGKNEPDPRLGADVSYWLLEKDRKDYLAEWIADVSGPTSHYSYRVFSLTGDGAEVVLQKNELTISTFEDGFMTLDIKDIRAFVNEVNSVLRDADLIAGIENKEFVHKSQRGDTSFSWHIDTGELEQRQAEFFGNTPIVHWFADEGKAEVMAAAADYVKERLAEAGITCGGAAVWSVKEIPTGTVGLWSGNYIYRVQYMLSEYDREAGEADEQLVQQFYVLTHEEWPWDDGHITEEAWHLMGILTEEEVQRYNTPELLAKYGGAGSEYALFLAVVGETARQWEELGLCKCTESS